MKKKISELLAFLIILNMFVFPPAKVFAASPQLIPDMNKALTFGQINPTPVEQYTDIPSEQIFMSWDLSQYESAEYKLTYPVADNRVAVFTFEKNGASSANVSYKLYNATGNTEVTGLDSTYQIHTNTGALGGARLIGFQTYIAQFNGASSTYRVVDNVSEYLETTYNPSFIVSPDRGFSFTYGNSTIHFKWDDTAKQLLFSANNIKQGNIYPFKLETTDITNPSDFFTSEIFIMTGFSPDEFKATPTANNGKTVSDVINQALPPNFDEDPGSPDVGLILEFTLPKVWDDAQHKFISSSSSSVLPSMSVPITLGNRDSNKAIQIIIADIAENNNNIINANMRVSTGSSAEVVAEKINDVIKLTISHLAPGLIFHETSIGIDSHGNIYARTTSIPFGTVFTFPHFKPITEGSDFYLQMQPYQGYAGHYMLKASTSPSTLAPSVIIESDGNSTLLFPLSVNSENMQEQYYQIFFSAGKPFVNNNTNATGTVYSQIFHYKAEPAKISVGIPNFFEVIDGYTLTKSSGDMDGQLGVLDMWLKWDIGSKSVIDKMVENSAPNPLVIEYSLNQSMTPDNTSLSSFAIVKLTITSDAGLMVTYSDDYGEVVNTAPVILQTVSNAETGQIRYQAMVNLKVNASHKENQNLGSLNDIKFLFPNIYFLNAQPISENGKPVDVGSSSFDSLTLNDLSILAVPPPQGLTAKDPVTTSVALGDEVDEVSFMLNWNVSGQKIREYLENSYSYPAAMANLKMNIYISQDEEYMSSKFFNYNLAGRTANSIDVPYKESYGNTLYFSAINSNPAMDISDYTDPREALRDTEGFTPVVRISGIPISNADRINIINSGFSPQPYIFKLDGLDKNQKYYVYVDLVVEHNDSSGVTHVTNASLTSNLVGITTIGDKSIPSGEDKIPSAPTLKFKDVDLGKATIYWDKIPVTSEKEVVEYEIIRLTDMQMELQYLDNREIFYNFWNAYLPNVEKVGWRTDGTVVKSYDGTTISDYDPDKYDYDPSTNTNYYTDKVLVPNKLYFYYVRTVSTIGDREDYSTWSYISLTTSPVQSPKNLKVEYARTDYLPKTEIIISFDAPVASLDNVGTIYNLQYQLKMDGQDWGEHVTMNPQLLVSSATASTEKDYFHFIYKISGLRPGTSYTIRVRMIDATSNGSLYTYAVQFRTDFDQPEYDNKQNESDWLNFLEQELKKLLDDVSWITTNTGNELVSVYRNSAFETQLATTADGTIRIQDSGIGNLSYYIPSESLNSANSAGKGLRFLHGNTEIIIAPNSIDVNLNSAAMQLANGLKNNTYQDYYFHVLLAWSQAPELIDGNTPMTQQVSVNFELVGVKSLNTDFDAQIIVAYRNLVNKKIQDDEVLKKLRDGFVKGSSNEELVKRIEEIVKAARLELQSTVSSSFGSNVSAAFPLSSLQKPITIVAKDFSGDSIVNAYQLQSTQWINIECSPYGDNFAIYTKNPGIYAFTASVLNIPGINELKNAGVLTRVISKYGLDEFFGRGSEFNLNDNATSLMVTGSIARMMGAPKGADAYDWLNKNRNITLSSRNMNQAISSQEAIYLAISLYETKSGTKAANLQIRNYNATANLPGLDEKYKAYVRAANELGIIDASTFKPRSPITVREILQSLDSLDKLLKL